MYNKKFSVLLLGLLLPILTFAQFTLDIGDVNTCTNTASVDIVTNETTVLTAIQYSISWDNPGLTYSGTSNNIFGGNGSSSVIPNSTNQTLGFFWFYLPANGPVTLNPGDILLTIDFDVSGTTGDVHDIEWCVPTGCNFTLEARGPMDVIIPVTPLSGSVAVGDDQPFMNCPADITMNNDLGDCSAIVSWATPSVADCDNNTSNTPVSSPTSGSSFPIGTTLVDITVEDDAGNPASCSFNVIVEDNEPPVINCPTSVINISVPIGTSATIVTDPNLVPTFSDNCSPALSYVRSNAANDSGTGNANGLSYPVGTTTVTYTVSDGILTADCSIDVVVTETSATPITLQIQDLTVSCDETMASVNVVVLEDVSISSASMTIEWNTAGLTYQSVGNVLFPSGTYNFGPSLTEPHPMSGSQLSFAYVDFFPFMINAGDVLFEINFAVSGVDGDCFGINFFNTPNPPPPEVLFIDPSFSPISVTQDNGQICLADQNPPSITCPAAVTINCGDDQTPANTGTATAIDDCDPNPTVTFTDSFTAACGSTGTITRIFTITDAGNMTATCVQTITIQDNGDPMFDAMPSPIADINCGDPLPTQESLTATDNCGTVTIDPSVDSNTPDACGGYSITYRWIATDDCGNTSEVTQTFNVLGDQAPPTFDNQPAAIADINCGDPLPTQETLTASDVCGTAIIDPSVDPFTPDACAGYAITYRWTATDECGNTTEVTQTFNVLGSQTPPTFESQPMAIAPLNCNDPLPLQETITASDDCGNANVVATIDPFTPDLCNGFQVTHRWVVTNDCGLSNTETVTFNVLPDTAPPTFDIPADLSITCSDDPTDLSLTGNFSNLLDNCDSNPTVTFTDDNSGLTGCNGTGNILRNWAAIDACGITSPIQTQIITVQDVINPSAECQNYTVILGTDGTGILDPNDINESSSDICGTVTLSASKTTFTCADIGTQNVDLIVTDECGLVSTCTAQVEVVDNSPGTISCPGDVSEMVVGNATSVAVNDIAFSGDADNCSAYTITYATTGATELSGSGDLSGANFNLGTTTVTYTITDAGGNESSCSFNIDVIGSVQIDCPDNVTQATAINACTSVVPGIDLQIPMGQSQVTSIDWEITGATEAAGINDVSGTQFNLGESLVTYTVMDNMNNSIACSFMVNIIDQMAPEITCPPTQTVTTAPGDNSIAVFNLAPSASDDCSSISVDWEIAGPTNTAGSTDASGEIFGLGTSTLTYTVADQFNNTNSCSVDILVNSGGSINLMDCPNSQDLENDLNECGAVANNIAPLLLVPAAELASVTWTASGATNLSGTDDASGSFFNVGTTIVDYQVESVQGTVNNCSFTITVSDTEKPEVLCGIYDVYTAELGECSGEVLSDLAPMMTDNCSIHSISYEITGVSSGSGMGDATGTTFNVGLSTITYTIADEAGNTVTCTSSIQVQDSEHPQGLICNSDTVVIIPSGTTATVNGLSLSGYTDNCGIDEISYELSGATAGNGINDASGHSFNIGTTIVHYTVTDEAGNSATCSFNVNISVADGAIACPTPVVHDNDNGSCGAVVNNLNPVITIDQSLVDSVTYYISGSTDGSGINTASGSLFNIGISTITYNLYSQGALTSSCSTTVTINDVEAPIFMNCPESVVQIAVENCQAIVNWETPTASDNCAVTISDPGFQSGDAFPIGTTTIAYTATDPSGQIASCTFTITVTNEVGPLISGPGDMTLTADANSCTAIAIWDAPLASNDCSPVTALTSNFESGDSFPVGDQLVTYTATDDQGNSSTYSFTVTVVDDTNPKILNCPPSDLTITSIEDCKVIVTWSGISATDNCGISTLTSNITSGDTLSANSMVSYFATDLSGNIAQCDFPISISDNEPPVWVSVPNDVSIGTSTGLCTTDYTWPMAMATDNCGDVTVTSSMANGSLFDVGDQLVTLTATDNGGNEITHTFTITVEDEQAPEVNCPGNVVLSTDGVVISDPGNLVTTLNVMNDCESVQVNLVEFNATDACDGIVNGTIATGPDFSQGLLQGNYPVEIHYTDLAGNSVNCHFDVVIQGLPDLELKAEPGPIVCADQNIQIGPSTAFPGSTVDWTGPNNFNSSILAPTITMNATTTGIYQATITTSGGCVLSESIELFLNDGPIFEVASNAPICEGNLEFSVSSNANVDTWLWSGPCNFSSTEQNPSIQNLANNCSGIYTVTGTSSAGCTTTKEINVEIGAITTPTLLSSCQNEICLGESCNLIGTEYSGQISYNWVIPEELGAPMGLNDNEILIHPTTAGTFEVFYSVTSGGCNSEVNSQLITVIGSPIGEDDFYNVQFQEEFEGSSILSNDVIHSDYTLTMVNTPENGTVLLNQDGTFLYQPFDGFIGTDGFEYEICQDCGNGECSRNSVILKVNYKGDCKVPTYLSPNGDGKNDVLVILCLENRGFPNNTISVFNRWGDEVFSASPYLNDWEGTNRGKLGKNLPDGTYYYIFQGDPDEQPVKGYITILR